jgi:hypothetical protein
MASATEPAAARQRPGAPPAAPWSGHAFGIPLRGRVEVDGVEHSAEAIVDLPPTTLELAADDELASGWSSADGAERLREWRFDDGALEGSLDRHPERGCRLSVHGYGTFVVSADGRRIDCAPAVGEERWRWQRCLIGQVLPLAAALRGAEVLHASAVSLGDFALGLVGASMAGKTSVAVNLVLRGAGFLADDVVALRDTPEGELAVYPGPGLTSVRLAEAEAIGRDGLARLGTVLGDDGEAMRMVVAREERPRRLAALYFLDRSPASAAGIEAVQPANPRLLLGSSFNLTVGSPERLARHLELCGRLGEEVPQFRVRVAADTTAAQVAERLAKHARSLTSAPRP